MFDNLPTNNNQRIGSSGPLPSAIKPGGLSDPNNPMTTGIGIQQEQSSLKENTGVKREFPKPPSRGAEDIFSTPEPSKPSAFQPRQQLGATDNLADPALTKLDPYTQETMMTKNKTMVLAMMLVSLVLVIIVGWYAYRLIFSAMTTMPTSNLEQNQIDNGLLETEKTNNEENNEQKEPKITDTNSEPEAKDNQVLNEIDKDTDGDGLSDKEERELGTNINLSDSDGDGLFDREEVKVYKTNPMNSDTDGDGYSDGAEVRAGYNPNGDGKLFSL